MDVLTLPDGSSAIFVPDPSGGEIVVVRDEQQWARPSDPSPPAPFRVVVPHTARHPDTTVALPANAEWVYVASSSNAYYAALSRWWADGDTFLVVEHDVVCRPDVIAEAAECPEPWCIWGYDPYCHEECREAWRNALGCTRFRAELMVAVPDALSSVPPSGWDWHNVCDGLGNNLRAAGFTHHWHGPPVRHHRGVQNPMMVAA